MAIFLSNAMLEKLDEGEDNKNVNRWVSIHNKSISE